MEILNQPELTMPDSEVKLYVFRWVCRRPFVDPLGLNDAQVVASSEPEALEYLLDNGGWRYRDGIAQQLEDYYVVLQEDDAPTFRGTWREWTQAVHHRYYPRDLVRMPKSALTQARMDSRVPPPQQPKRPRKSMMGALDRFLSRQVQYRRAWRLVGWLSLVVVGAGILWVVWQALVTLVVSYFVIRAIAAGMRG